MIYVEQRIIVVVVIIITIHCIRVGELAHESRLYFLGIWWTELRTNFSYDDYDYDWFD